MFGIRIILITYLIMWASLTGCIAQQRSQDKSLSEISSYPQQELNKKYLVVMYKQATTPVTITFIRVGQKASSLHWNMIFGSPFKYSSQTKKPMGTSISKCSFKNYTKFLDKSLTKFNHLHPNAEIDSMEVGTFTVRDLWDSILTGLHIVMYRLPGTKSPMHDPTNDNLNEPPEVLRTVPCRVLKKSQFVVATRRIFLKHNMQVGDVDISTQIWFKESLNGHRWTEISKLPDAGIAIPGSIQFDIQRKR